MGVLVERSSELVLLAGAVTAARSTQGGFVVVEGAAGIGKTTLLTEAAELARAAGGRVLSARGTELERQFGFGLVRQLFEPVLAAADERQRARLLAGAATPAGAVLGFGGADSPGDFAVLHGLFWLTANLCQDRLLMLTVDDLHWADHGSLRFLSYLQPRLDGLPVMVVVGTRPHEPGAEQQLLDQLQLDRSCVVVRPAPLTVAGAGEVIREVSGVGADEAFLAACHETTGGNPLLLRELVAAMVAEGLAATAGNARRVHELGRRALASRLRLRLAQLPAECAELVRAVALLGDDTPLPLAAVLAGLDLSAAAVAAHQLQQIHVLSGVPTSGSAGAHDLLLGFVHPLVRAAVYDRIGPVDKMAGHAAAARLLLDAAADPERIASHLLRVPPAGDPQVVAVLRRAAGDALGRGSPDTAVTYLERSLNEPPPDDQRLEVLEALGQSAVMVDAEKAVGYLRAAVKLADRPGRRIRLVEALGHALFVNGRNDEATVVYQRALDTLAEHESDLRSRLQAHLINVASHDPSRYRLVEGLAAQLRRAPDRDTVGSRMRDGLVAFHDAFTLVAPEAADRAWRCVADGSVAANPNGTVAFGVSCWILAAADRDEVMGVFDACLGEASRHGSFVAVAAATLFRSLVWLWRGSLAEAEADARESLSGIATSRFDVARPFATGFLADTLMEQGRLDEADSILPHGVSADPVYRTPQSYWLMDSRSRLLLLRDRPEDALRAALDCGRRYSSHGWTNPAFLAWRSTAALAAHRLGRAGEACDYALAELELARRWGAPRALGHALRVAGLVGDSTRELRAAVEVLEGSGARLEHAKALVDLGTALRRGGQVPDARARLADGLELAVQCGATPLVQAAESELRAAGARVRRHEITGLDALTPSESRVAALAAEGLSNRDIAQRLFVNVKTVEIHLSSTYRKLGITGRTQLADRLSRSAPEASQPAPAREPAQLGA